MGMVFGEVAFDGRAPELSRIADKITEVSGLPVSVTGSAADVEGDLYDMHTSLAFACAPEERLEVHTYLPGAVREFYNEAIEGIELPTAKFVQGMSEPAGTQTVYLRGYIGQEPTLLAVAILALEALGGHPRHPTSEELRREYGKPITTTQLTERRRKLRKQGRWGAAIVLLLLPVLIPLCFVGCLAFLVAMPWRIWKGYQLYRTSEEGRGSAV
jgi:hypothetical protein